MSQIYSILGSDEGRVTEEALHTFNTIKPQGSDDFGNDIIEGKADNTEEACKIIYQTIQALETLPFFNGKAVWLKGANFLGDDRTGGAERTKEAVEQLSKTLQNGLDHNITFLISASSIDKRRGFYKFLKKSSSLKLYDKIDTSKDGWEDAVAELVLRKAQAFNLQFTNDALDLFVQQAGENSRQIVVELEKLDLYLSPEKLVTLETVQTLIPLNRKGVIWEISRAIGHKNSSRAIELVNMQLEKGESAIGILRAAITPTLRNTFYAKLAMQEAGVKKTDKRGFNAVAKRVNSQALKVLPQKADGSINTWSLANCVSAANERSIEQLIQIQSAALKADKALVTSGADEHMILHRLIIEATS